MPLALVAQELPSMQSKYLSDLEDVFNSNEERELKKMLNQTAKLKNDNICLLTVVDFGSYERIEEFTYAVSNAWNLGPKGILIVMSKNKRQIRIETSSEIWTRLSDEECKSIIDFQIVPSFKEGKYFEGIRNCLVKISEELK